MQPDEVFRSDGIRKTFWSCWKPAWQLKLGAGSYRVNYDLHRAAGLWLWVMLFVIAWSAVAFQLREQVYTPVMSLFFDMEKVQVAPERKTPLDAPRLSWREAYAFGQRIMAEQSLRHGFTVEHETGLRYDRRSDMYPLYRAKLARHRAGRPHPDRLRRRHRRARAPEPADRPVRRHDDHPLAHEPAHGQGVRAAHADLRLPHGYGGHDALGHRHRHLEPKAPGPPQGP
jgi:hypothetical protein